MQQCVQDTQMPAGMLRQGQAQEQSINDMEAPPIRKTVESSNAPVLVLLDLETTGDLGSRCTCPTRPA